MFEANLKPPTPPPPSPNVYLFFKHFDFIFNLLTHIKIPHSTSNLLMGTETYVNVLPNQHNMQTLNIASSVHTYIYIDHKHLSHSLHFPNHLLAALTTGVRPSTYLTASAGSRVPDKLRYLSAIVVEKNCFHDIGMDTSLPLRCGGNTLLDRSRWVRLWQHPRRSAPNIWGKQVNNKWVKWGNDLKHVTFISSCVSVKSDYDWPWKTKLRTWNSHKCHNFYYCYCHCTATATATSTALHCHCHCCYYYYYYNL